GGKDAAETIIGEGAQVDEGVFPRNFEALVPAEEDHVQIEVEAPGLDSALAQHLEELAAAADDVEDAAPALEVRDVGPLALSDDVFGAPEPLVETGGVEIGLELGERSLGGRRSGIRRGGNARGRAGGARRTLRLQHVEDPAELALDR